MNDLQAHLAAGSRLRRMLCGFAALLIAGLGSAAEAQPGRLDSNFGNGGTAVVPFDLGGSLSDVSHDVAVQPDGKILLLGYAQISATDSDFAIVRLNPEGTLDTSFGTAGKKTIAFDLGGDLADYGRAVAVAPDGKILVAGYAERATAGDFDPVIARLDSNGNLDPTFGTNGRVAISVNIGSFAAFDIANDILLQPDGKILVGGSATLPGDNTDFMVLRLNADGSLDTSFDSNGIAIIPFNLTSPFKDNGEAMVLQADGKIVIVGSVSSSAGLWDFGLARLLPNGSLDTTFDGDGRVNHDGPTGGQQDFGQDLALDSSGRIVAAGRFDTGTISGFGVMRLLSNGALDTTFDGDGRAFGTFAFLGNSHGREVALQADGKIVVAGHVQSFGGDEDFGAMRFLPDGSRDGAFGVFGAAVVPFNLGGNFLDRLTGMVLLPDGEILLSGQVARSNSGDQDFALAQLLGDHVFSDGFESGSLTAWSAAVP